MKKIIYMLALVSFVSACAKKSDQGGVVNIEKPPVKAPAAKVPGAGEGSATTPPTAPAPAASSGSSAQGSSSQAQAPAAAGQASAGTTNQMQMQNLPDIGTFTGTADDYLNQKLTYLMDGDGSLDEQARNLIKAKEIKDVKFLISADGVLRLEIQVPETAISLGGDSQGQAQNKTQTQSKAQAQQKSDKERQISMLEKLTEVDRLAGGLGDDLDAIAMQKGVQQVAPVAQKAPQATANSQVKKVSHARVIRQNQIILEGRGRLTAGKSVELYAVNTLARHLAVKAKMECAAIGHDCETKLVTLTYGDRKKSAKVQIILRSSSFNFELTIPTFKPVDPAYDKFVRLFDNSQFMDGSPRGELNVLSFRKFESFEVINGRSQARITMQSLENEFLMFKTYLQKDSSEVGSAVDTTLDMDQVLSLTLDRAISTDLSEALSEVRLVANDGRGNLSFSVQLKNFDKALNLIIHRAMK